MSTTTTTLLVIFGLAAGTYAFRVAGVLLRDRLVLPERLRHLLPIAATTLLAALVATAVFTESGRVALGLARPVGVLVGAVLAWRRAPFVLVVVAAAATAALLRLAGLP
ncbi:branched-chain amino acid transporter [Catellatospora sp. TT07R-123]|uniref:AzlD domain-containing protein n=1 Tax=Catellatospora sp. TT07R-123 TaxID=2733863 RepID=UPI001B2DCC5E|nr:AzlD domain-containing protein [Catellatospora sp. TT07R-123]GHJ45064.1 branched-chain amino acid transporter [Catellatospora sp. TT07R-123]